jgi:hypothetical protein
MNYLSIPKCWTGCAAALMLLAGTAGAQVANLADGPIALAANVTGIVIDGDLSDWPEDTARVPMRNDFGAYGGTDLDGRDLSTSDDFSPAMMVGYDDEKDLLYVAVIARDDRLVMDGDSIFRDGIEIYLSDLSAGSQPYQYRLATSRNAQVETRGGDLQFSGTWRNYGDHLIYEWQGGVPNGASRRSPLEQGDIIGFDVVAIDNDGNGNAAWVPWGPPVPSKSHGNDRVGRLLLAPTDMSVADAASLTAILSVFNGDQGDGLEQLHNLARHEDDFERLIESLVERNVEVAGPKAAALAAQIASQVAAAVARAGAVATAEARMLESPHIPAVPHIPHLPAVPVAFGDNGMSPMAYHVLNFVGGCAIILAIGFTVSLIRRSGRSANATDADAATAMDERMAQIEARMTDTQDVMIALSEKLDRIDDRGSKTEGG